MPDNQSTSTVAVVDVYSVNDTDDKVTLTLNMSDGDSSVTNINLLPGEPGIVGSLTRLLGTNKGLKGQTLTVTTLVIELSGNDDTSMTIVINGGKEKYSHKSEKSVIGQGDSVLYTADIAFI